MCLEMSGHPDSLNAAIVAAGNGGDIVLFGLHSGDMVIPNFEEFVVSGKKIHSVIGRRIFDSWKITQSLLEDTSNGIQEKIWKIILEEGKDTIINLAEFTPSELERKLQDHPKILLRMPLISNSQGGCYVRRVSSTPEKTISR